MNRYSIWWALCPLLFYCSLGAQNSSFPTILDYGGGTVDSAYSLSDSTFCKGSVIMLRGNNFVSTNTGDTFDSLVVHIDSFSCQIVQLDTSSNASPDTLIFQVPDRFISNTCLTLYLVKYISNSFGQFPYLAIDTICLTGDFVQIEYADQQFCIGDTNPLPITFNTTDTLGSFCCYSATPGFLVLDNGEIPLHPGAIGLGQSFHYITPHAACPDTNSFQVDILPPTTAVATYSGGSSVSYCPSGVVLADTGSLFPMGGHFSCLDSGLVILDDSLGMINLGTSVPGIYSLAYGVSDPCVDTAWITIEIMSLDSVSLVYPLPYQGPYQRICPNQPPIAPFFLSGQAGGNFVALPNSLALDSNGIIDPALSTPGNYTIMYISPGLCPDTVIAALNLSVDTLPDASFVILPEEVCSDDSILVVDTINSPGTFEVLDQGVVIFNTTTPAIPIAGLLNPNRTYLIRHIATGPYCADTAYDYLTVFESGNANFAYNPNFYCLGDPDPIPFIFGNGGGIFKGVSGNTVVDSLGRIDLGTSGPGIHFIQYTSPGLCPDSLVDTVQINNSVNAFFSYPTSQFCKTDSPSFPQTSSTGGIFSSNDPGLVLDSISGMIDLQSSTPGLYEVTYSFIGSCQTSYSTNLLVLDFPGIPTLNYPADSFCREATPQLPLLSTDSSGAFLGTAGVVFLNPITGILDLSLMQAGGPYQVTYDIANPCASDPIDSFFILEAPFLDFSYPSNATCQDATPIDPNINVQPLSQLSFTASSGLTISPNGTITPNQSQAGSFVIHCQTNSHCPAFDSADFTIYPLPQSPVLYVLPDTVLCAGDGLSATLTASDGIGFRFLLNSQLIDSAFFRIDLDQLDHGDLLTGVVENVFGCTDTIHQRIVVLNRPSLNIDPPSGSVLESGFQKLRLTTDLDQTAVDWFLDFHSRTIDSGNIVPFNQTGQQTISITGAAQSLDPALYHFQAIPSASGCQGDTLFASYIFLNAPFFVPEVITPNGDGKNDLWQVVWRGQVDPMQYEIIVFNRAGGEVHRMAATSIWDGGTVPDGVYWWLIRNQEDQESQKGGLTIRRK